MSRITDVGRRSWSSIGAYLFLVVFLGAGVDVSAQTVPPMGPATPATASGGITANATQSVGVIPQPTIANPGLVTGITLGELYTDNLTLSAPGQPKESGLVTQIEPFLKTAFDAPRFSGLLDYTLTGYLYKNKTQYNQLAQNLDAFGTLTVLPQHLFLDGTATYGRRTINQAFPSGAAYFLSNNQANLAMGTLSPYWVQGLGGVGTATLRYTHGRVVYDTQGIPAQDDTLLSGVPNITSNALEFSLVSPKDQIWGWNLLYSNQRLEPDLGSSVDFGVASLETSVQASRNTRLLATVGKENKFLPDGTVDRLGAGFWNAGFEWSDTRNDFKLLTGHRFFGRSYELSWNHQAALLTTTLSYVEEPTDLNQQWLDQNPGTAVTSPFYIPPSQSLTEFQPYLSKRATASAGYTMPTGTLTVTLYDELRTYFASNGSQERVANADVSWLFNIGAFTTFTPTFGWQRYRFQTGQINYTSYAQLALVHQFNPANLGSVSLRRGSANSYLGAPGAHGYRVNVIFISWTRLF